MFFILPYYQFRKYGTPVSKIRYYDIVDAHQQKPGTDKLVAEVI